MHYFNEPVPLHPFYQKQLVFTGGLSSMTRTAAVTKATAVGAIIQRAVTASTHFVILGAKSRGISSKQLKAQQLNALGNDIQFINEQDFLWLLSIPLQTK